MKFTNMNIYIRLKEVEITIFNPQKGFNSDTSPSLNIP